MMVFVDEDTGTDDETDMAVDKQEVTNEGKVASAGLEAGAVVETRPADPPGYVNGVYLGFGQDGTCTSTSPENTGDGH